MSVGATENSASGTALAVPENKTTAIATGEVMSAEMALQIHEAIQGNVDASELQISRLALLQPASPEISGALPGYAAGQIIDSLTRERYSIKGKAPWLVGKVPDAELPEHDYALMIPCFKLPTEFIKWIKKEEQQPGASPWEWKTVDPKYPGVIEGVWPPIGKCRDKKPPVTTNINFLAMMLKPADFSVISPFLVATFARTSYSAGKDLVTQLNYHRMVGLPYWGRTYYLYTTKETRMVGTSQSIYYVLNVAKGPDLSTVNKEVEKPIMNMAWWLADKNDGKARQESFINRAAFDDAPAEPEGEAGGNGTPIDESDPFGN